MGGENGETADIVLAGVSRTSKTPTSIYLANRGFKTANIPIVPESPTPNALFTLKRPMIVGITTGLDRLVQVGRNRLLSLNQAPEQIGREEGRQRVCQQVSRSGVAVILKKTKIYNKVQ